MKKTLCALICCAVAVASAYRVLAGRTGNGKSYIATLLGCPSKSCHGRQACTKETKICPDVIDTIGLDDDGEDNENDYTVMYNGQKVRLSGLTYPIYALFDQLESKKISDVEFFLVSDANNPRAGLTQKFFTKFVTEDLKCPINTVLNKYRKEMHSYLAPEYDILVTEGAISTELKGKNCVFGLAPNWRDKVIMSDLAGVISTINLENCKKLKERSNEFKAIQEKKAQAISTKSCMYEKVEGTYKTGNSWGVNIGPISFGGGGGEREIKGRHVDEDCARIEAENNAEITAANQRLHEEKISLLNIIQSIDEGLNKCKMLVKNVDF